MRPCLSTLLLFVSLTLFPLPSKQGTTQRKPSTHLADPQIFSCRGYLPPWGGTYASWGLIRNPSLELNPGRTGEIPDLTDLCSRRSQLIPIRSDRNVIRADSVEDHLLYEGRCMDGRAEFLTVKESDWKESAALYLRSLGDESIDILWGGHQRILDLCLQNCFCQYNNNFRVASLKAQRKMRDMQKGQQHNTLFQSDKTPMGIPYREHFERPYGPFFPGLGPLLGAEEYGAQGSCSALDIDAYDDRNDGIPIRVGISRRRRRRKQAQRQRLKCMIDRESSSLGG